MSSKTTLIARRIVCNENQELFNKIINLINHISLIRVKDLEITTSQTLLSKYKILSHLTIIIVTRHRSLLPQAWTHSTHKPCPTQVTPRTPENSTIRLTIRVTTRATKIRTKCQLNKQIKYWVTTSTCKWQACLKNPSSCPLSQLREVKQF